MVQVTFEVAKKDDLWFHASGVPGAHVVLRTDQAIQESDVAFAADVAAHFSRGKEEAAQSVLYTRVRNVRRAGAPGLVTFRNEKSTMGIPDRVREDVRKILEPANSRTR